MGFNSGSGVAIDNSTIKENLSGQLYVDTEGIPAIDVAAEENAQQEIEIIELQANASITPLDHDSLISETFSDATGYNNLVDTGNTDATFTTNKYKRANTATQTDIAVDSEVIGQGIGRYTNFYVLAQSFLTGSNTSINKVSVMFANKAGSGYSIRIKICPDTGSNTPDTANPLTGSTVDVAIASITNGAYNDFTFSSPLSVSASTKYWVLMTTAAEGSEAQNNNIESKSKNNTYSDGKALQYISAVYLTGSSWSEFTGSTYDFSMKIYWNTTGTETTKVVRVNLPAISGTVTYSELVINDVDRETGDNVTYKLYDSDAATDDSLAVDTKNALVNCSGAKFASGAKIDLQLSPKTATPTDGYPSVKSFCLKLWKA